MWAPTLGVGNWVSSWGRVFTKHERFTGLRLNNLSQYGRLNIGLRGAGTYQVHRLVAAAHGAPGEGPLVRHLDGNCLNNYIENLRYGTQKENMADAKRHGTWTRGERMNTARLTEHDVLVIRMSWPQASIGALARKYGVAWGTIARVVRWESWRHVGRDAV